MKLTDMYSHDKDEKPLDRVVTDGGLVGIFRTIACVGDSLSSGELVSRIGGEKGWHDLYDYSWGQYMARMAGCRVYNFSCGGLTARGYMTSYADSVGAWDPDKAAQAYIIALGVNDILNCKNPTGSIKDVCDEDYTKNKEDFCGYYCSIIARYKKIQPRAKFFLVTIPHEDLSPEREAFADAHAQIIYDIAEHYDNTYVIDLRKYAPPYDEEFKRAFYLADHLNVAGYLFTARMMCSYIDYIIRHNFDDFRLAGFIGTGWDNEDPLLEMGISID